MSEPEEKATTGTEYFPYSIIREHQDKLISDVYSAIKFQRGLIAHAPTGLGKTAATLAPALKYAIEEKKTIFFLTSRHTQHTIIVDTLKKIKEKHNLDITIADIIGKKWMCLIENVSKLSSSEFSDFCKDMTKENKCPFFVKARTKDSKPTLDAKAVIEHLNRYGPFHIEEMIEYCKENKVCPYEIATFVSKNANVIISDYYYIFNSSIRDNFFRKIDKELKDSILIIDEGHNLPERIRELATSKLSSYILSRAIKEAKKFGKPKVKDHLEKINLALESLSRNLGESISYSSGFSDSKSYSQNNKYPETERLMQKSEFFKKVNELLGDYEEANAELYFAAEEIRLQQKQSFVGSVALFMESWLGEDKGFSRIISVSKSKMTGQRVVNLTYRCLDPSLISEAVLKECHSSILMSGTLNPTSMYKDLLGFPPQTKEEVYTSPFPHKNRLNLVVPITTTKFTSRTDAQFEHIARITAEMANQIQGNVAIYFPSYSVQKKVIPEFEKLCKKTAIIEHSELNKVEKKELIEKYVSYKNSAVLLAVIGGSFNEGIDIPNNIIKGIIIVGLPLKVPDLETKELIAYFDLKFKKGWDYGYIFPAFNKVLQSAGRCIRSGSDRGVIVFLDERYTMPNYFRCFPVDQKIKITREYIRAIDEFFKIE